MYAEERVSRAKYARHNVKQIQKRKSTMRACATRAKETRKIYVRTKREFNNNYQRFFFQLSNSCKWLTEIIEINREC